MSRSYISVLMYDFHLPSVEGKESRNFGYFPVNSGM